MTIFDKRVNFKPFEYPEVMDFVDKINHSYWLHSEWNFTADIQDFHVKLNDIEKNAIKNTLLAISQIEVSVKTFWAKLHDHFPKPEINSVGVTFGESEARHERAYSHLLEVLDLNGDFELLLTNPVIQGRVDYLSKYLKHSAENTKQAYTLTLALFSLFIENVSLFSQFAIIKSFNKERNILKDIDNVVQATQREELCHALFGVHIIGIIKREFPEWFDESFYHKIDLACKKAYKAEAEIIDWIFEKGELEFLPKETLKEFIKDRFNQSVIMIGGKKIFDIDDGLLEKLKWFNEEINAESSTDFFHKRPVSYSKNTKAITESDLF